MIKNKTHQNQNEQKQEAEKCPRCNSTDTKFCYYNNYSKSQPRYLCKACKRHWTQGGSLRNVPVGRARKNKRLKPSSTPAAAARPAHRASVSAPSTSQPADGLKLQFSGSSSSSFDSLQSSQVYDCVEDQTVVMEEFPWRMEASCFTWDWDVDVDALVSTNDHELSAPWDDFDDPKIKSKP